MGEIYSAVKNLIFFLLLVTVFMNLLGKSSFRKYINIFVGLIIILIVIKPVLSWTDNLDKVDHYYDLNAYQSDAKDISAEIVGAEAGYQKQVVSSYKSAIKKQIETQIKNYGLTIDKLAVTIEEDLKSEECGQIKKIVLEASKKAKEDKQENKKETVPEIDQVTIDKVSINKTKSDEEKESKDEKEIDKYDTVLAVSYTHLTLPTICSV